MEKSIAGVPFDSVPPTPYRDLLMGALVQVRLLLRVFFFNKQVLLLVVGGGGFHDNWDFGSQEILSSFRTFTNEAERTLDLPRRRSRQGTSTW